MRSARLLLAAATAALGPSSASTGDYIYSDAFERRVCDGVDCTYCSPADPQPLCGTHSHCVPQLDATSLCTYPDGNGLQGALCSSDSDCAGPLGCFQGQTNVACRQWCDRGNPTCPAGTTCTGFSQPAMIGLEEWGVCL